jgi:hypothetical protein
MSIQWFDSTYICMYGRSACLLAADAAVATKAAAMLLDLSR